MSGIRVQLSKRVEKKFRETAMKRFGYGKGALSKAAEEAFQKWLASPREKEEAKFKDDPVKAIEGLLAGVKIESVELQHMARKLWAGKYVPH
ncbi:MAG: hypothetical protein HY930_01995 [Euryarchaeota archaeon]|nr:hypothetical protein [Euryarchaeota archaeon]